MFPPPLIRKLQSGQTPFSLMHISDFDYELPDQLIAQQALPERAASRMLVLDRKSETWHDSVFTSFPDQLSPGDVVVVNNTRVFPARLHGQRSPSGGAVEILLLRELETNTWEALTRPARRLQKGERLVFGNSKLRGQVVESLNDGIRVISFESDGPLEEVIDELGEPPLPPYIKRKSDRQVDDRERYQTVYAKQRGAIAAPTAGLHFTPDILEAIRARGATLVEITLHVGYGTFEPVKVDAIAGHQVAAEWFSVTEEAADNINAARNRGCRIVAVGTTTARALESTASAVNRVNPKTGFSALTIVPGYRFRAIDMLLTNFHLPRSSLLILVSAFVGRELTLAAYRHAVTERYRFYSYGDCMLIK
jgi:S-adenosylmethionine:tRNA ribosyltransferase-isomerase